MGPFHRRKPIDTQASLAAGAAPSLPGSAIPPADTETSPPSAVEVGIENALAPSRITVGAPTVTFESLVVDPARFRQPYRADMLVDGWSTDKFCVRAASVRGDDHRYRGKPRQDEFVLGFHPNSGGLIIAVADGVSAAQQSHLGATAACRYSVDAVIRSLDAGQEIDWESVLKGAAWAVVETAQRLAESSEPDPTTAEALCGTTLCLVLVRPTLGGAIASMVSVGDSGSVVISAGGFAPVIGGKTPESGISSSAVTGLPRVPQPVTPQHVALGRDDVLLVATDGILDPLGEGRGLLGQLFLDGLSTPPDPLQFCRLVDFSRETFDDDRTMVAVWRRADQAGPSVRQATQAGGPQSFSQPPLSSRP
jgi:serine/threonine protein phosphatase PrpC